jgi:hypothetical protein
VTGIDGGKEIAIQEWKKIPFDIAQIGETEKEIMMLEDGTQMTPRGVNPDLPNTFLNKVIDKC